MVVGIDEGVTGDGVTGDGVGDGQSLLKKPTSGGVLFEFLLVEEDEWKGVPLWSFAVDPLLGL